MGKVMHLKAFFLRHDLSIWKYYQWWNHDIFPHQEFIKTPWCTGTRPSLVHSYPGAGVWHKFASIYVWKAGKPSWIFSSVYPSLKIFVQERKKKKKKASDLFHKCVCWHAKRKYFLFFSFKKEAVQSSLQTLWAFLPCCFLPPSRLCLRKGSLGSSKSSTTSASPMASFVLASEAPHAPQPRSSSGSSKATSTCWSTSRKSTATHHTHIHSHSLSQTFWQ